MFYWNALKKSDLILYNWQKENGNLIRTPNKSNPISRQLQKTNPVNLTGARFSLDIFLRILSFELLFQSIIPSLAGRTFFCFCYLKKNDSPPPYPLAGPMLLSPFPTLSSSLPTSTHTIWIFPERQQTGNSCFSNCQAPRKGMFRVMCFGFNPLALSLVSLRITDHWTYKFYCKSFKSLLGQFTKFGCQFL